MSDELPKIGLADKPADEETLGIERYIAGLSSFIKRCPTPMTIAIQGDWGSGKTTVMNMIKEYLDKEEPKSTYCIDFNTWQYSQFGLANNLSLELINTLIWKLKKGNDAKPRRLSRGLKKIGLSIASIGANVLYGFADNFVGSTNTGNIKSAVESMAYASKTVAELNDKFKKHVDKARIKHNVENILFFIDDIDRLEPYRAVQLLEVMKNFMDCENCVFILALDYAVVVNGVKVKYGNDFSPAKAKYFFDKIIQVPFKMPDAHYDINKFVKKSFSDIERNVSEGEVEIYEELIRSSIGRNPRSMKRLFNSFLVHLNCEDSQNNTQSSQIESSGVGLFAILCMQLRFEYLLNYIMLKEGDLKPDFFFDLSSGRGIESFFDEIEIDADQREANKLKKFIGFFNKAVGLSVKTNEVENMKHLKQMMELIMSSTVLPMTATPAQVSSFEQPTSSNPEVTGTKKRVTNTYMYKGDRYGGRGEGKKLLGDLALKLVLDYVPNASKSAKILLTEFSKIPCYDDVLRENEMSMLVDRTDPRLDNEAILESYYTDDASIVKIDGRELLVAKWWNASKIEKMRNILGYDEATLKLEVS